MSCILIFVSLACFSGFAGDEPDYENSKDKGPPLTVHVTGHVIKYSITSSLLEDVQPERTLWILLIKIESIRGSEKTKLKKGDILKVYSDEKVSARLYDEEVKATVERKNDKHWLVNLSPRPPAGLPLASNLYGLLFAEDPADYAHQKGIQIKEGKVKVIIELETRNAQLPQTCDLVVESRSKNLARAWVSIEQLIVLAEEDEIGFIRTPHQPEPQS